ncbi:MAG TPA: hypothetical protein VEK33_03370 [Terriglobales bacterium]|nr:hypothetical protein [Terriglobales bacterium]
MRRNHISATDYEKLKTLKAAWQEKQGAEREVLVVGEMEDPRGEPF